MSRNLQATNMSHAVTATSAKIPLNGTGYVLHITNMGTVPVTLHFGDGPAVFGAGVVLPEQYSSFSISIEMFAFEDVFAITQSGTSNLAIFYV